MSLTHVAPWLGGDIAPDDQSAGGGSGSEVESNSYGNSGNSLPAPALQGYYLTIYIVQFSAICRIVLFSGFN